MAAGHELNIRSAAERLESAGRRLESPESPEDLELAVFELEQACREWPPLMACLTDRTAWESLASQIRRLERLAEQGGRLTSAMQTLNGSARGYTGRGEPAAAPDQPAKLDCRG